MTNLTQTISGEQIKRYLESVVAAMEPVPARANWMYQRYEELVLDCGFIMEPQSLPETIECGAPKFGYWNCQKLAFASDSLTYVEGYALHADVGFPISHAWLLTPDGYAIDPTWDSPGCYFGVPLSTTWVESVLAARTRIDNLSIFDGNYIEKFSLLKEGLPVDAFANLLR
ncbi:MULTISPECIES: hypothetical protein [unclassified Microcoleus]|uniref:hypothetical protein n=1 Tax=unclassified Microcoleus TaxID=2642155 RepID=UPI002FD1B715